MYEIDGQHNYWREVRQLEKVLKKISLNLGLEGELAFMKAFCKPQNLFSHCNLQKFIEETCVITLYRWYGPDHQMGCTMALI